jgi:hypothetical protein
MNTISSGAAADAAPANGSGGASIALAHSKLGKILVDSAASQAARRRRTRRRSGRTLSKLRGELAACAVDTAHDGPQR